jgi:excisionase family DNA binding protein
MTTSSTNRPLLYTIREAAEALRVSRATVYRMTQAGELPTVHIGTAVRIPAAALARYVEDRTAGGNANGAGSPPTPLRGTAA